MSKSINYEFKIVYLTGILASISSFVILYLLGYSLSSLFNGTYAINNQYIYMIPLFFAYGILVGHFFVQYSQNGLKILTITFGIELILISFLSFLRISIWIPVSGHAIILSYYLLTYTIYYKNKFIIRTIIGSIVLLYTIYVKLAINDLYTLIIGSIAGSIVFFIGFYIKSKKDND